MNQYLTTHVKCPIKVIIYCTVNNMKNEETEGRKKKIQLKQKQTKHNLHVPMMKLLLAVGKTTVTVNVLGISVLFVITVFLIRVFFAVGGELRSDGWSLAGDGV